MRTLEWTEVEVNKVLMSEHTESTKWAHLKLKHKHNTILNEYIYMYGVYACQLIVSTGTCADEIRVHGVVAFGNSAETWFGRWECIATCTPMWEPVRSLLLNFRLIE